jgi:hypothetical protein
MIDDKNKIYWRDEIDWNPFRYNVGSWDDYNDGLYELMQAGQTEIPTNIYAPILEEIDCSNFKNESITHDQLAEELNRWILEIRESQIINN